MRGAFRRTRTSVLASAVLVLALVSVSCADIPDSVVLPSDVDAAAEKARNEAADSEWKAREAALDVMRRAGMPTREVKLRLEPWGSHGQQAWQGRTRRGRVAVDPKTHRVVGLFRLAERPLAGRTLESTETLTAALADLRRMRLPRQKTPPDIRRYEDRCWVFTWHRRSRRYRYRDDGTVVRARAADGKVLAYERDHTSREPSGARRRIGRRRASSLALRTPLTEHVSFTRAWRPSIGFVNPNATAAGEQSRRPSPAVRLAWLVVVRQGHDVVAEVWIDAENGSYLGGHLYE